MPIIRKRLYSAEVYPDDIRYNDDTDTVQRLVNDEWVDAPESDPRKLTTFPPRTSSDPRCDSAASVADALKNQLDQTITGIENGMTAIQIAGLILGLFSFGVFAIFINIALFIADLLLDAGSTALDAALTPDAYEKLTCALYCQMDSQGRLDATGLANAQAEITSEVGGLGATVLNAMLSLAGEGGINNLGAIGTSTGDCAACSCAGDWCYIWEFPVASYSTEWEVNDVYTGLGGAWTIDVGWQASNGTAGTIGLRGIARKINFADTTLTRIKASFDYVKGTTDFGGGGAFGFSVNGTNVLFSNFNGMATTNPLLKEWNGVIAGANEVIMNIFCSRDGSSPYTYNGNITWHYIQFEGNGINPFGEDNCP